MKKLKSLCKLIYSNLNISAKMTILYLAFLILSVMLTSVVYYRLNYHLALQKNRDLSMQTLYSLKSNIYSMLDNVSFNSRTIMANLDIQDLLTDVNMTNTPEAQRKISSYLVTLMDSTPHIKSVYIFDNYDNRYGSDKKYLKKLNIGNIKNAWWYDDVVKQQGYYIVRLNADRVFNITTGEKTMSLLRIINNTTTQNPIGLLMVNISEDGFKNCYSEIVQKYGTRIIILDENNQIISTNDDLGQEEYQNILAEQANKAYKSSVLDHNNKPYLYSTMFLDKYSWKMIIGIPLEQLEAEGSLYKMVSLLIIILNGIFLCIGIVFVSRLITSPIHKLLKSMKAVEQGEFNVVQMETVNDEIGQLKNGYNLMVVEIQNLIKKIVNEQRTKRKAELNILQEQIKPHFLYNTLDAMGYLALAGKNEEVYEAIEAMGGYYRKSLSKGSEIISVADEIEIVKDYVYLQLLRYGDIFTVHYDLDEDTFKYKTVKLVLQPLVENSIYHGIKPKGEYGDIYISSKIENEHVVFIVEDNGLGMNKEDLKLLEDHRLDGNLNSFGLRGTIQRIKIYYDRENLYSIESTYKKGTKITLRVPIHQEVSNETR
ncbi:histidine kinase [Clostridium sp. BNL1100]|uniref:sensor histidine kinase n=1 Tax=Clostridium sp. BNL1100 TaxID=755731 RepID=UPI00024A7B1D|nr:histidine kinase [Clostridium sp. BNL1100]AEY64437.1 putative signal transduction protein with a C-terminal ATPase domain [Clostridium sp. BNL1100]